MHVQPPRLSSERKQSSRRAHELFEKAQVHHDAVTSSGELSAEAINHLFLEDSALLVNGKLSSRLCGAERLP